MDLIAFIESDVARATRSRTLLPWALSALLLALSLGLGIVLREDRTGVLNAASFASSMAVALSAAAVPWLWLQGSAPARARIALVLLAAGLLASSHRVITAPLPTSYASAEAFRIEALKCLIKGMSAGTLASLGVGWLAYQAGPVASRPWRRALSLASGLTGVAMLGFHCDSSSLSHLLLGHWAQALGIVGASQALQSLLFRSKLHAALGPARLNRLRHPGRLG